MISISRYSRRLRPLLTNATTKCLPVTSTSFGCQPMPVFRRLSTQSTSALPVDLHGCHISEDASTITTLHGCSSHALTIELPDGVAGYLDLLAGDTSYAGQVPSDAAPGNIAHHHSEKWQASNAGGAAATGSANTVAAAGKQESYHDIATHMDEVAHRPRVDIAIEAGWREGLEVQLLRRMSIENRNEYSFEPMRLAGQPACSSDGSSVLSISASEEDALIDVSLSEALFAQQLAGADNDATAPLSYKLLIRTPQMLDLTIEAGAAVACDVSVGGKLEGDLVVDAPRGSIAVDKVRGTSILLTAGPAEPVTIKTLLETSSAIVRCGSLSAGKVMGKSVAVHAHTGPVAINAAYVRQLKIEATPPSAQVLQEANGSGASKSTTAASTSNTAVAISTMHGAATIVADRGDVAVGGITGSVDAQSKRGAVSLHIDSARGGSRVRCAGSAEVTLLPPVDLPLHLRAGGKITIHEGQQQEGASDVSSRVDHRGGSGKVSSGTPITGFYSSPGKDAPAFKSTPSGSITTASYPAEKGDASAANVASSDGSGWDLTAEFTGAAVIRRLSSSGNGATILQTSNTDGAQPAAATTSGATESGPNGGFLEVAAGGDLTLAVIDWATLVRRRMQKPP